MCSICGVYRFSNRGNIEDISKKLQDLMIAGEDRGRDSFGFSVFGPSGSRSYKFIDKPSNVFKDTPLCLSHHSFCVINNDRAEPTTEFVKEKTEKDVQPFYTENKQIFIAHNGTIANDKDLEKKYNLKRDTKIDSAIIPPLLEEIWDGNDSNELARILREELIGSYAISIYNAHNGKLWLATNYKPLFVSFNKKNDCLWFMSLETYFDNSPYKSLFDTSFKITAVEPYSLLEIKDHSIEKFSLWKKDYEPETKKKALIICSSGLDSTVCASWAKSKGYDISLLHFKYSCRAEEAEIRSINNIAKFFNCELVTIPVDFFKNIIKHSRLTNPEEMGDLVKDNHGEASAELAWEWVPARNLIFMSIAAGYAEAKGFDYIILGGNLEESSAYVDNELIFQKKFNYILPNALNLQNKVEVLAPVANLMKHEIVKLGLEIGAPLHLTWSCYENGTVHCGECGPCFMRRTAFKMLGKEDIIPYKTEYAK